MLTYRSDVIAKVNLKIALETVLNSSNVRLILGYGGDEATHGAWLNNLKFQTEEKYSFELFYETSVAKRLNWALDFPSEWVIFVTDDDIISSNYLSALIKDINCASNTIANIFPRYYGINNESSVEYLRLEEISDSDSFSRAVSYILSSNNGIRYYSAHRVGNIKKLFNEKFTSNFLPSYLDQLITLSTLLEGASISCSEPNILIYNLENWVDAESCIKSDAKFYEIDKMIFFHEILWMTDYVEILYSYCTRDYHYEWIKSYCLSRINDCLNTFIQRLDLININAYQAKAILDEINHLAILLNDSRNMASIRDSLNQCKDKIFNKISNKIYFGLNAELTAESN
jgi:hypothetical protein